MDENKIGKFIASLRKEKRLTQQQLGDKLFVTDKAVSKWERGLSFPDISILEKLAEELGVDISELVCGKKGKNKKINIQEEIDKAIKIVKDNQNKERKQKLRKIKKTGIILLSIITILFIVYNIRYRYYHPSTIVEGDNHYEIGIFGIYNLEKNGLDEFVEIINKTEKSKDYRSNISNLNIELSKSGNVNSIGISLNYFDDELNYIGNGSYRYKNKSLVYNYNSVKDCKTVQECELNKKLVNEYSKSLNVKYVSEKLKKIPYKEQIKLSNLNYYVVSLHPNQKFTTTTSVYDMRDNRDIKALSLNEYKSGKGGKVNEGIYLVITLSDGSSAIADETYRYVFDNVDGDIKKTDYTMETDYFITTNNQLLFTRDYGNSWIKTDLSPDKVKETLSFYRDISLQNGSWFISKNELIPIAYFYGEKPKLKLSNDNGETWNEYTFDIVDKAEYINFTTRVVGFINQNFGYVALGTDWTMGSGEIKKAYETIDGGKNWKSITLPEQSTNKTLKDYIMYDESTAIVLLNNASKKEFPYMYMTKNKGNSWIEVDYLSKIPREISYISNIDYIEKNGNQYVITLSQGDSSTTKIKFKSTDLIKWYYDSTYNSNIHTVG